MFTEFGGLGKIGVNSAGVGVHLNILTHKRDRGIDGVPVHSIVRRVLDEACTVDEAETIFRSSRASASSVLTVVNSDSNEVHRAACFEILPERVSVLRPDEDGWPLHTNNFIVEDQLPGAISQLESKTFERLAHVQLQRSETVGLPVRERAQLMCGPQGMNAPV